MCARKNFSVIGINHEDEKKRTDVHNDSNALMGTKSQKRCNSKIRW